jgi:hypothetical protein
LIDESVAPPEQRWARRRTASAPAIVHLPGRESTELSPKLGDGLMVQAAA